MGLQTGISGFSIRCCPYSTPVFKRKVQIYFPKLEKLMPLKEKFTAGPIKSQKMIFFLFSYLNKFLSKDFEVEDTAEIKELVLEHLKLLKKNFNRYFSEEDSEAFRLLKWVVNPFIFTLSEQEELLDICNDMNLEEIFEKIGKEYFWIFLYKEGTAKEGSTETSVSISQYLFV